MADLKISQFVDGGAVQETDEIATNRGGVNTKVYVGSAAAQDVGSGIGDVVQLEDVSSVPGLPAVDGSQLTGVSAGVVTVADESADTTCFILFGTAATGSLQPKTNSSLTFNADTGALSATTLSGTLSTPSQPNITSLGTLSSLTLGGTLVMGANSITITGSIAATGSRVTKGWFTDIESSNAPTVGGTGTLVNSDGTGVTGADKVSNIMSLTQSEYDGIGSPDAATLYIITDA